MIFRCKNDNNKKGVKIAYRSETVEKKKVKMDKVGSLPGISRTRVKAHVHRWDLTYTGHNQCTHNLKNRPAYTRTDLHTHEFSYVCRPEYTHAKAQTKAVFQHFQACIIQNQS